MMKRTYSEPLEPRYLLAGITLLAPAYNGGLNGWLDTAVNGITAYLGGPQNVPQYVLTIAAGSNGSLTLAESHVSGTATPQANNPGQIIVTIDYTSISTNPAYSLSQIAGLVTNYMMNTSVDGVRWASLPIDEISLSRGNSVTDTIAQLFDESGVWVNQETYLDPRPIHDAPFSDPNNAIYDNVEFADDYWRTDGQNTDSDPSGVPINGAYNLELPWVQADSSTFVFPHLGPASYYDGTIDPADIGTNDGDGVIHSDWYGNGSTPTTFPSPTQTGFLYTTIVGGTRPLSGVWAASGGSGARSPVTHSGLQWPNISDVAPAGSSAQTGGTLNINYIQQDQSQADTVTFTLDSNQNPFDGSAYTIGTQSGLASSSTINSRNFAASLKGVTPGTYYIGATVTDASGLARFDYSINPITITSAATTTGGSISGLQSTPASSVNLTTLGTSDWAHWGLGGNGSAFDHKSTGGSQISNVTRIGSGGFGGYTDPSRNVSWSDGTPVASDGNDTGYIWANNNLGAGYSFTVPASTTARTVDVYVGGYSSGSTLTATLSDGSSNPYTISFSGSSVYNDVVAITFNAASANQTLTLSYTKTSNINGNSGSADLIAAWIPTGTQTTTGGSLAGSPSTAVSSYNLTSLGTSDWAHWGLGGSAGQFDHKSAGNSQISNVTTLGSGNYGGYSDPSRSVSWTDGAPLTTESADSGYIWANNAIGAGYSFTAPASTTSRTVDVYVGGYSSGSTLTATLSDGSASPYTVSFSGTAIYSDIVAITYQAASANQLLTLSYTKTSNINGNSGSADLIAAWIPGGTQTASGGSLAGSPTTAVSPYNLTSLGTSDWAHWGLGGSSSQFDHKATGNSQISNVTTLGSGSYGGYSDPSRSVSWSDGTPLSTDSADSGYLWANNAIGAGYSFTAPADTTSRTLYVYVGGYSSGSTLTATLSDGSAAPYTVSFSGNAIYSDVVAITYQAASANQSLTISYTKTSNINGASGSADLVAAWIGAAPAVGTAPAITTNPTSQSLTVGTSATFTAAASGSPAPSVQWMVETPGGSFSPISGATSTTLNLGSATLAETGNQYEAVFSNGVGSAVTTSPATLTVTSATASGSLTGVQTAAVSSYNLTALGTTDWAHWGIGGAYVGFVHKSTGNSQISNVTVIGPNPNVGGYTDPSRNVSWTDGTPTTSNAGDHGYIWDNGGIGSGYSFTVPASTTTHTLFIYAGGYESGGTLTAALSDNAATPYTATASGAGIYGDLYTLTFAAGSSNQTLTITYKLNSQSTPGGSIDLVAAATA